MFYAYFQCSAESGAPSRIGSDMAKIDPKDFRVLPGHPVDLRKWPTRVNPVYGSKDHYHQILENHIQEMSSLQTLLYASNQYAVLLIFQAMDAAGKDGAIKHVMSGVNPQGCQVYSFKHPGPEELDHDFFWRAKRIFPSVAALASSIAHTMKKC